MATATPVKARRHSLVQRGAVSVPAAFDNRPEADLSLRKSKVVREGERALSIRAQEERGRAWAEENSYRVRKVWKENLSAWSDVQRPKYDVAMDAVLNGEVPALWCYALDRFSRKGAEAVVPILGKAHVIFDYERLDSMDERDRRWIIDRAENAREYSQRLSHNVRSTKNRQRNEGRWLARAPFGLVADPRAKTSDGCPRAATSACRSPVADGRAPSVGGHAHAVAPATAPCDARSFEAKEHG
ncbi:recombinase family protein [Streptomyces sp. NPDC002018]|uniref:recombinase family protein n=1 Tax=Streptomyces sp. NPDC002018 TaxID=3364629 RepID=UPI00369BF9A5